MENTDPVLSSLDQWCTCASENVYISKSGNGAWLLHLGCGVVSVAMHATVLAQANHVEGTPI